MKPHMDLCVVIRLPASASRETVRRVVDSSAIALGGIVHSAYLLQPPQILSLWDRLLNALGWRVTAIDEVHP